jgi:hypothetical protein
MASFFRSKKTGAVVDTTHSHSSHETKIDPATFGSDADIRTG